MHTFVVFLLEESAHEEPNVHIDMKCLLQANFLNRISRIVTTGMLCYRTVMNQFMKLSKYEDLETSMLFTSNLDQHSVAICNSISTLRYLSTLKSYSLTINGLLLREHQFVARQ